MLVGLRAMALLQLLELEAAASEAEGAEDAARLQGEPHQLHFALWIRALVHDVRGEASEAERAVYEGSRLTALIEPSKLTRTAACDFAALDEDPQRAIDGILAAGGDRVEHADPTWQPRLLLRLVRAAIAAGELDDAERWAEQAAEFADRMKLPASIVRAATACAEVLLARGDAAGAAAVAEEAVALGERRQPAGGAPLDVLEARMVAGRALAAAGTRAPATCSSASPRTPASPEPRRCTTPRDASCASSARASPPPRGAWRGATRRCPSASRRSRGWSARAAPTSRSPRRST